MSAKMKVDQHETISMKTLYMDQYIFVSSSRGKSDIENHDASLYKSVAAVTGRTQQLFLAVRVLF